MIAASLDSTSADEVHVATEEPLELLLHIDHVEERVPGRVVERDQHVDVAVRAEIVAQYGARTNASSVTCQRAQKAAMPSAGMAMRAVMPEKPKWFPVKRG